MSLMTPLLGVIAKSQSAPNPGGGDPYFSFVQLLLHLEGANHATTTTDQIGHTMTFGGSAEISTTQAKAGSSSLSVPGSGSLGATQVSTEFNLGSGDWCVEGFWYLTTNTGLQTFYSTSNGGGRFVCGLFSTFLFIFNGAFIPLDASTPITTGAWHHVAFVRNSGTYAIYLDGTRIATSTPGTNIGATGDAYLGHEPSVSQDTNGYIDEFRLTVGSSRGYTGASITVPTVPLPNS